jgi:hypothetical protein
MALEKPKQISKLSLDDFMIDDFALIAIITPLENFKLAYHINKNLEIAFVKEREDIEIITGENLHHFTHYSYDDANTGTHWRLIENQSTQNSFKVTGDTIIFDEYSSTTHFLPEFKTVDYLIKIEDYDEYMDLNPLITQLLKIKNISTVYQIDNDIIKSKKNLFL